MARGRRRNGNGNGRRLSTQQSANAAVKSICDIMRRSNCAGALQYVPELTWILFLRVLDEREQREAEEAEAVGADFTPSPETPYRWRDWADPDGPKRRAIGQATLGAMFAFLDDELLPYLKKLENKPGATPRQKVISGIMSGVEPTRIDTEKNFLDVLDRVHALSDQTMDPTHVFPLSQVYEGLLLKMGEKGNAIHPIALANLVLHRSDEPHIWHGNTLTGQETYGGLFAEAPPLFDVILMTPPFGGKEGKEAQTRFACKTGATQVLFRTNETAFVQTKRKLLDECDLFCIVSLPPGTFVNAGAGVKTNLLFFTRGRPTWRTWYYDLSAVKVGKKTPLTLAHFEECLRLQPERADNERSWTVTRAAIETKGYDIKAVNQHARSQKDLRTPEELLDLIEARGRQVAEAVAALRALRAKADDAGP